jgi:hypothetical protein
VAPPLARPDDGDSAGDGAPGDASIRASVWAEAWPHAAMVSAAIKVRVLMSLWRQVAVKPISPSERLT